MLWGRLAERQIQKARAEGQLDHLKGEGKPLDLTPSADPATDAGFRMMADAGALPPEISLRKQVETARAELAAATGTERKAAMARLADLEMRLAIEEEIRRRTFR